MIAVIIFGLLSLHIPACHTAATDTISAGQGLSGNDTLVSGNGRFALGFFQPFSKSSHDASNWYLGVWFNTVSKFTPAWVANGDKPVISPTSPELTISSDGNLVIIDQTSKSIVWSTQANTITSNNTRATLLNTGNLVLYNSSNSSHILWQSFDYPTDTHLAGAKLGWDKVTGLKHRLVSRKNSVDPASGMYTYELHEADDSVEFRLVTLKNSAVPYWSSGKWNGHYFGSIPEMTGRRLINFTFVNNEQEVYFTYTVLDDAMIVRFALNVSGQTKILLWVESVQEWVPGYSNPNGQCDVYGTCGPFSTCEENKLPCCICMEGFSVSSPDDWELEDRTGGCTRNTPLDCGSNTSVTNDGFYPMPCVELPDSGHEIGDPTRAGGCAQVCLGNCKCTAYSDDGNGCFVWDHELTNVKQKQCRDTGNNKQATLYLRLATRDLEKLQKNRRRTINGLVVGAIVVSFGLLSLFLLLMIRRSYAQRMKTLQGSGGGIIVFRYTDLQRATKNFSDKLGAGGFGSVFKGFLNGSSVIAVKRLDGACQGEKQFRAEVRSLGVIQHINLLKLIGFCTEGEKRLLVYEHMPNHSLDAHLFRSGATGLKWSIRYDIALGVARGLAYLHDSCRDCIIHCDIKPENILLDASFIPKIGDFGLAKFLGREFSQVLTTMRGTRGYLAPEWLSGTVITAKVDVYSYGMVLLEILSGKRNTTECTGTSNDDYLYFPVKVARKLLEGGMETLVDNNLHGDVHLEQVKRAFKVAFWCIQEDEFDRPTMGQVVQYLEDFVEVDMPPIPRLLQAIVANPGSKSYWYLDQASQEARNLNDAGGSTPHLVAQP